MSMLCGSGSSVGGPLDALVAASLYGYAMPIAEAYTMKT